MNQSVFLNADMQRFLTKGSTSNSNAKSLIRRKSTSINTGSSSLIRTKFSGNFSECKEFKPTSFSADKPKDIQLQEGRQQPKRKVNVALLGRKKRSHVTDSGQKGLSQALYLKNNTVSSHSIGNNQSKEFAGFYIRKENTFRINRTDCSGEHHETEFKKKLSKGSNRPPLRPNNQFILQWINDILMTKTMDPITNRTTLSEVKKYMIDPASLKMQNVRPEDIDRIYRSLYVYSEGFGQFIAEVCGNSRQVCLNIWRIYSILLEYCSLGTMETTIAALLSEKQMLTEKYKAELQQKQFLIENNEELNQQKNIKIIREIKDLAYQNQQLNTEKVIIANQLHDSENAFNEEISLRLLFEEKINKLHYAYRQLSDKHHLLYRDFKHKEKINAELSTQVSELLQDNTKLKQENWGHIETQNSHKADMKILENQLLTLKEEISLQNSRVHQLHVKNGTLAAQYVEMKHTVDRLKKEHLNTEEALKLTRQSYHILQGEFQQVLMQNQRMITAMEMQNETNNLSFREKSMLSQQMIAFQNDKAYFEKKITLKEEKITDLLTEVNKLKDAIIVLQQDRDTAEEVIKQLNLELETARNTIASYRTASNQTESNQKDLKLHVQTLEKSTTQKNNLIVTLREELSQLKDQLTKKEKLEAELSSEVETLKLNHRSTMAHLQQIQSSLAKQELIGRQIQSSLEKEIVQKDVQCQKWHSLYDAVSTELKNQRFQRKTLDISYKHSLTVIDSNVSIKKELKTKIAQLQERLEEERLQNKVDKAKFQQHVQKLQVQNRQLKERLSVLEISYDQKKEYIHRMHFQDLRSLLIHQQDQISKKQKLIDEFQNEDIKSKAKISGLMKSKESEVLKLQGIIKEKVAMHELDVEYECKKNKALAKKVEQLEMELATQKSKSKAPFVQHRQKQQKYLDMIKALNTKIDSLMKEVEQIQDKYYKLMQKMTERETLVSIPRRQIRSTHERDALLQTINYEDQIMEKKEARNEVQSGNYMNSESYMLDDGDSRDQIRKAHKKSGISQDFNTEEDIHISIASKHSKQSKPVRNSKAQIQQHYNSRDEVSSVKKQGSGPKPKNDREAWRQDLSSKMKNALKYYK